MTVQRTKDCLTDSVWQPWYRSTECDILHDFYIPALRASARYDRVAGYFTSTSLAVASQGFTALIAAGSLNESKTALTANAENLMVRCDWEGAKDAQFADQVDASFEAIWNDDDPGLRVLTLPDAVRERLIQIAASVTKPKEIDGSTELPPEAPRPSAKEWLQFAILRDAPRMPNGRLVGMVTAPVEPWPHQAVVARRLIESWPYSFLLCDEVGLGKTIEAGLALRSIHRHDPELAQHIRETVLTPANRMQYDNWLEKGFQPTAFSLKKLLRAIFASAPLSRVMMCHNRALLRVYQQNGELKDNLAHRHVLPMRRIQYTSQEKQAYDALEDYAKDLAQQVTAANDQQARVSTGFYLSFLRRRFASSLWAIAETLRRRRERVATTLEYLVNGGSPLATGPAFEGEEDFELDDSDAEIIDQLLKNRSEEDLRWELGRLSEMLGSSLYDAAPVSSKMQALLGYVQQRKDPDRPGRIGQMVILSQFWDTPAFCNLRRYQFRLPPGAVRDLGDAHLRPAYHGEPEWSAQRLFGLRRCRKERSSQFPALGDHYGPARGVGLGRISDGHGGGHGALRRAAPGGCSAAVLASLLGSNNRCRADATF